MKEGKEEERESLLAAASFLGGLVGLLARAQDVLILLLRGADIVLQNVLNQVSASLVDVEVLLSRGLKPD